MNDVCMCLLSMLTGYAMCLVSTLVGVWIFSKLIAGKGILPFMPEPKGEVFTIEDTEDLPFPEEEGSEAQEHILERTNKFLQTLGGK